jgi:peptidyl-prolyl cis-trans isomerase D
VKTATGIGRNPAPGATGPLANAKFLNALFSPDSVEKKRNTEAVETGANQLVSGRVTQYTPARTIPFADVKERVRERVLAVRGAELARKEGEQKLGEWKASPQAAALPEAIVLSRDQSQKQPPQVVEAALRADPAALPAFVGVDLGAQGYAVVKVNKIAPRDAAPAQAVQQDRNQYTQWWTAAENLAYYEVLKERFKVQFKVPKPAPRSAEEIQASMAR